MTVRIVSGTSTGLTADEAGRLGVALLPLHVHCDGWDATGLTNGEIYRLLRHGQRLRTSAATPGEYLAAFRAGSAAVLCLTESARISSGHRSALTAARLVRSEVEVEVIDSGTAAGGLRLLVAAAAGWASRGMPLRDLSERVRRSTASVHMAGMVDDLSYLARSGRVPEAAAWAGSLLAVRPVVRFVDGRARLVGLHRTRGRALRELCRLAARSARELGGGPAGEHAVCTVFHADAPESAEEARLSIERLLPMASVCVTEMTPAMGIHTGPGTVAHALCVSPPDQPIAGG